MGEKKIVRAPVIELLFGLFFMAASVFEFVSALDKDNNVTERNSGYTYGVLGLIIAVFLIVMYFMVKYEYDETGFTHTSVFGSKRNIAYTDIFSVMYTNKNSLRIETKDGLVMTLSTSSKAAKEFADFVVQNYKQQVAQSDYSVSAK